MSLSIGIVGLPNVGKSTLFNALLKRQVALSANYPFATIEPNVGIVDVPDARLEQIATVVKAEYSGKNGDREVPEKIIPAVIKFYDIAGLVKGASQGEGLGNQFLAHIREVDAIVHVVRDFADENVIRAGAVNPKEDATTINTELILSDIQTLEKRLEKLRADVKKIKTSDNEKRLNAYESIMSTLNAGTLASVVSLSEEEKELVRDLNLLTLKPMIFVLNVDETNLNASDDSEITNNEIRICAKIESELSSLDKKDQADYLKELGIAESGLDKVIKRGYETLGLQTFFTAGPKEVRAWTIKSGNKAPQAAGAIHTDFERGFISAEVVSWQDYVNLMGLKACKDKGLVRIEGKNYTMRDGDIVEFRFSV